MAEPGKVSYVTAFFGGKEVHFELQRGERAEFILSMAFHQPGLSSASPFRLFQNFGAGTWTPGDIRTVLQLAYRGELNFAARGDVQMVLETAAPGVYAVLASRVLEAYLFGLDKATAVFDERQPYGAEEAAA